MPAKKTRLVLKDLSHNSRHRSVWTHFSPFKRDQDPTTQNLCRMKWKMCLLYSEAYTQTTYTSTVKKQQPRASMLHDWATSPFQFPIWKRTERYSSIFKWHFISFAYRYVWEHAHATEHVLWKSEDNVQESVLSFHFVGPRELSEVIRLCGMYLYLQSHLVGPRTSFI